jgi:hypothetical protein
MFVMFFPNAIGTALAPSARTARHLQWRAVQVSYCAGQVTGVVEVV